MTFTGREHQSAFEEDNPLTLLTDFYYANTKYLDDIPRVVMGLDADFVEYGKYGNIRPSKSVYPPYIDRRFIDTHYANAFLASSPSTHPYVCNRRNAHFSVSKSVSSIPYQGNADLYGIILELLPVSQPYIDVRQREAENGRR